MKAIIITRYNCPNGDAGAVRQHTIAMILREIGYDVTIIGLNNDTEMRYENYYNVKYVLFPLPSPLFIQKGLDLTIKYRCRLMSYFSGISETPDLIIMTRISLESFQYVKKYAKKNNVPLIHDCVEWFSFDQVFHDFLVYIPLFVEYITAQIQITSLITRQIRVISISQYLHHYFTKKNISSMRLPICLDSNHFDKNKLSSNNLLKIMYAGVPGGKDYLKEVVLAIRILTNEERENINFKIFGIDLPSLAKLSGLNEKNITNLQCIHALGRVPRNEIIQHLNETDFTILIRSSTARYAKAGFPTKVVESLMSSTPVILNMTSDLGMYLKDGYDCIEVEHEDPESIVKALRKALALTPEQKDRMKKNARKTAEENFDYRLYIDEFGKFIKNES